MYFLRDTNGYVYQFESMEELKEYIEIRHAEAGGFDWISEVKDSEEKNYGCSWSLQIIPIG